MRSFEVPAMPPTAFVETMRSKLAAKEFDRYVTLDLRGDSLIVELRWMGTTRLDYRVQPQGDGFRAELVGQRVAPLHTAFTDRFEHYFEDALAKAGARTV